MAEGKRLQYVFTTSEGKDTTVSFNYASENATTAQVKTLAQAMINNKSVFASKYAEVKSAKLIVTSEFVYDLNDTTRKAPYTLAEAISRGIPTGDEVEELTNPAPSVKIVRPLLRA